MERHVGLRESGQGWTDRQMITLFLLLNLAGGESVEVLRVLEKDEGLGRVLGRAESLGDGPEAASGIATKMAQGASARAATRPSLKATSRRPWIS